MNSLLERINHVSPEFGDLRVDRPETHRWLPTPMTPVLATPAVALLAVVAFATAGGSCVVKERCNG
jgi:hypothetical protein